mmetsp:Transcript_27035/g.31198  ORF Transcript_27035/g.31198 Transcript_27035/m.31198 type:complete len:138 (+) Transcript_27035:21-434(+)
MESCFATAGCGCLSKTGGYIKNNHEDISSIGNCCFESCGDTCCSSNNRKAGRIGAVKVVNIKDFNRTATIAEKEGDQLFPVYLCESKLAWVYRVIAKIKGLQPTHPLILIDTGSTSEGDLSQTNELIIFDWTTSGLN